MSVKNIDRVVYVKNLTTGEQSDAISYGEVDDYKLLLTHVTIGEYKILNLVRDILCDNHNVLISNGYKNY